MLRKCLIAAVVGMTGTFFVSSEVIPTPYRPIETIFEADSISVTGRIKGYDPGSGQFMRQLVDPYRGKYLLVDFWDITCGPCRAGIEANKERRDRHRGNPGFAFLFLASEKGSPLDRYSAYVEKNLNGERVMRLPEDQMILLRELFEFNGIPRYILFNPESEVVNSNSSPYDFWELLKEKGIIDESGDN
ncbi:MAG: hypothetical protein K2F96_03085 [Muribaculaceae bacterium]|nr:hypothetical protein [Muribaculaceae bacterium]